MVLLKHSGGHAFRDRTYELTDEEIDISFLAFKDLAEKKKAIFHEDIPNSHRETHDSRFCLHA